MYDMGTFLRERYANFLENQYVPSVSIEKNINTP